MKAKKIGKIILRILLVILILFVVFVIGVFVFHQVKRNEEMDLLKEKGYTVKDTANGTEIVK